VVYSAANTQVNVTSGDSSRSILNLGTAANPNSGRIAYNNATQDLQFSTNNGGYSLTIDKFGDMGVGTETPSNPGNYGQTVDVSSGDSASITLSRTSASASQLELGTYSGNNVINSIGSGVPLRFLVDGSERMRINATGNVGIGYGAPETGIDCRTTDYTYSATAKDIYASFGSSASGIRLGLDSSSGNGVIGTKGSNDIEFVTYDDGWITPMTIRNSGNVGIGATNPQAPLHVNATSTGNLLVRDAALAKSGLTGTALSSVNETVTTTTPLTLEGSEFSFVQANSERVVIDSSGNVGIGTASPSTYGRFVVQGSGSPNSGRVVLDGFGTSAYTCKIGPNDDGIGYYSNNNSRGHVFYTGTADTERMRISASGTTTVTGGFEASRPDSGDYAFAAGYAAGANNQGGNAVAVGIFSGQTNQGSSSVAVGINAAKNDQGDNAVAVGFEAGKTTQGPNTVAIGNGAANNLQETGAISIGYLAGAGRQQDQAISIGQQAGQTDQGESAIAVGYEAGKTTQAIRTVAIGRAAGQETQASGATAIGYVAAQFRQGTEAVALGYAAGYEDQGANSIAIGKGAGQTNQGDNGIIISSRGVAENITGANHIMLTSGAGKYFYYNGTNQWTFSGGNVTVPNDSLLVGRTSLSAAATDHGWQVYNTGIVYQYADAATSTDVHRWYNGAGSLVASINARGEGFFLGGATYSGPLKADEIIQDGAPVVDSLQIIRAFMKLRAATADPDSTVEELREKLKTAVDDIIDQFQDQIDNMPTPLED
jgi:hypothetical protein